MEWSQVLSSCRTIVVHLPKLFESAYYFVGVLAAAWAVITYRQNSKLERSRWASTLFEKFYESDRYKAVRDRLDDPANAEAVRALVASESADFTDYLNFFEYVLVLLDSEQLERRDVDALFRYYLKCLSRHDVVRTYIANPDKDYEALRAYLTPGA